MRKHILGIDHAVIVVRDLDQAEDTWSRLGFTLTPRGFHTLGSQNHCLMFGSCSIGDYIELLAVPKPHPATQFFSEFLATGDGLASIALATDDASGAHAELTQAGFGPTAPRDFSRPVILPEGIRDASFRIVQLAPAATPGSRTFICQHFTRDVVWRPDYTRHPLGVTGLAGIAVISGDVRGTAGAYAKLLDAEPQPIAEGLRIDTGGATQGATRAVPLAITTARRLAARLKDVPLQVRQSPLLAALFFRVADRATAANVLRRGGFSPISLADGSCAIGADQANGVALVFG
ncbi:MAG: VOC family protein [Betaproteobacteria bacterium]|nr:VOC family protein [Betaproteobacteria bacterium]